MDTTTKSEARIAPWVKGKLLFGLFSFLWRSPSRRRSSLLVPVATAGFDGRLPANTCRSVSPWNFSVTGH